MITYQDCHTTDYHTRDILPSVRLWLLSGKWVALNTTTVHVLRLELSALPGCYTLIQVCLSGVQIQRGKKVISMFLLVTENNLYLNTSFLI